MSDDNILGGFAAFTGGIRDVLAPILQARAQQNIQDQVFAKRRKAEQEDAVALLERKAQLEAPQIAYERGMKEKEFGLKERAVAAREKAAGAKTAGSGDLDELLKPNEALALGVPYGTRKRDAVGISPRSQTDKDALSQFDSATALVDEIEGLSKKVNTFGPGKFGENRLLGGIKNTLGSVTQTNDDVTLLDSKKAQLASILRALGERGVLTDEDIARGENAVPKKSDTKEVAVRKIKDLRKFFSTVKQKRLDVITTPIRKGAGGAGASTPDPADMTDEELMEQLGIE